MVRQGNFQVSITANRLEIDIAGYVVTIRL